MAITKVIGAFPPAPNSSDTPEDFNSKADAFVSHQAGTYVPDVNELSQEMNAQTTANNQIQTDTEQIKTDTQAIKDSAVSETTAIKNEAITAQVGAEQAESNARISEVNAKESADKAEAVVIPTEATYTFDDIDGLNELQNFANFNAYGLTKREDDRYLVTDIPNLLTDQVKDSVRLQDGLVERSGAVTTTMPLAPFDPASTDELLDDKVNGVTTQTNHTKGDIVVTGNELVTNGTFDTDIANWDADGDLGAFQSWDTNSILLSGATVAAKQTFTGIVGLEVSITFTITEGTSQGRVQCGDSSNNSRDLDTQLLPSGTYTYTYVQQFSSRVIRLLTDGSGDVHFDNVSITAVEDTYQAIADTTSGDLLTDTAKFQTIPDVTRQDVIAISKSGYKTYKGLAYHDELVSTDDIATSQGFSKLGNGLYNDGIDDVTIVGLRSVLNAGGYHPVYNSFGTSAFRITGSTVGNWYASPFSYLSSKFETLTPSTSTAGSKGYHPDYGAIGQTNGRPDSRFYDKVYSDGYGGVIEVATYTDSCIDLDVEATKLLSVGGLERGVSFAQTFGILGGNIAYKAGDDTVAIYMTNVSHYTIGEFLAVTYFNGTTYTEDRHCEVVGVSATYITIASAILGAGSGTTTRDDIRNYIIRQTPNSLLSQNNKLSTDVICDPANYPQDWKNHLASGKSIDFNPLLVGEEGEDYIPDDSTVAKHSDKMTTSLVFISSPDSGASWSTNAKYIDSMTNKVSYRYTAGTVNISPYTSQNKPLAETQPTAVIKVLPKAVASNSHDITLGAMVQNVITGKVSVSDSANSLESRTLENVELKAGVIHTVPSHNTITLNADVSPASKWFVSEVELANREIGVGVFGADTSTDKTGTTFTDLSKAYVRRTGVFRA